MAEIKLLDLFCGAGGASMGYYKAGFEVEGVDIKPQPHYPFKFYQADALEFPLEGYDAYHASPPCQGYVDPNIKRNKNYPRLIEPTRELLIKTAKPFVIENVYKAPLKATIMLCGTMFGLPLIRHRYFEWSLPYLIFSPSSCNHWGTVAGGDFACVVGYSPMGFRDNLGKRQKALPCKVSWAEAMGIDWMPRKSELKEAIPPAYTEYIGKYLISAIKRNRQQVIGLND